MKTAENTTLNPTVSTSINHQRYPWSFWRGQTLRRKYLALDTETPLIEGRQVPDIVLASVSDGEQSFILRPHDLPRFIETHFQSCHVVFHNIAFDFHVLDKYLSAVAATTARAWLWTVVEEQRVHDTMLLAGLIGLAIQDNLMTLGGQGNAGPSDSPKLPSLAVLAKHQLGIDLPKDQYRTEYESIVGADWTEVDQGFFAYAIHDAVITYQLYCLLSHKAKQLCNQQKASREYGFLSEAIQIKAAICLDQIGRRGLRIDQKRAAELSDHINALIDRSIENLEDFDPDLFRRLKQADRQGELIINKETGLPRWNKAVLKNHLAHIAKEHNLQVRATSRGISDSVKDVWSKHRDLSPLIESYCELEIQRKKRSFIHNLPDRLTSRYNPLVRTGRTSCYSVNLQQFDKRLREVITASPGSYLFVIDYSALELRTLAAWCEHQFGFSKLGDVLRNGIDPHCYMAAMLLNQSYADFMKLKETDKAKFKATRQASKAVGFGFPGGLGIKTFCAWAAKPPYNVELTEDQARHYKQLWFNAYPEMRLHLQQVGQGDHETAVTPTGRIRSQIGYCSARNFPFQGLAGDGCKLAMWELLKAGYDVQGFIHDEFIIELPSDVENTRTAQNIDRICCEAMKRVCGTVPIECEYALTYRWDKRAEAVFDADGELQAWELTD